MTQVLINGVLTPADKAFISVDERGFRFGDGVFETLPVQDSTPYLWEYHEERLLGGLAALGITRAPKHLLSDALKLLKANRVKEGILRIYVSRGIGSLGYLPLPLPIGPTVVMQTLDPPHAPSAPVKLWQSTYEKISPKALPTAFKLAQGVNATLARMEAEKSGCFDALQLDAKGHVAETSSANLFWLAGGTLYTPSPATGALAGVTRRRIMELSPYPVKEGAYPLSALLAAQAVVCTNAALGIIAIAQLLPSKTVWSSEILAQTLAQKRAGDIKAYAKTFREGLALS